MLVVKVAVFLVHIPRFGRLSRHFGWLHRTCALFG
jgi:hypothetical protein